MAKQLPLTGIPAYKKVKAAPKETTKPGDKLEEELKAGNRPLFMTAGEIMKHANLGDAWNHLEPLGEKSDEQKAREATVMRQKTQEAKVGGVNNSHKPAFPGNPTLADSIREKGYEGAPIQISDHTLFHGTEEKPEIKHSLFVKEGHHRLAAMKLLHPQQFIPVNWR